MKMTHIALVVSLVAITTWEVQARNMSALIPVDEQALDSIKGRILRPPNDGRRPPPPGTNGRPPPPKPKMSIEEIGLLSVIGLLTFCCISYIIRQIVEHYKTKSEERTKETRK